MELRRPTNFDTLELKPLPKKVIWADKVGSALTETIYFRHDDSHQLNAFQRPGDKPETSGKYRSIHSLTSTSPSITPCPPIVRKSYNEALLAPLHRSGLSVGPRDYPPISLLTPTVSPSRASVSGVWEETTELLSIVTHFGTCRVSRRVIKQDPIGP